MVLTKDDVKAIKQADSMVVWFRADEGTVRLRLTKKLKGSSAFDGENEVSRLIEDKQETWEPFQAVFSLSFAHYGAWQLLAHTVREGDELTFTCQENSNGYLEKAMIPGDRWGDERRFHGTYDRLYHDELLVTVRRGNKELVRELVLQDSTCPQNSARAIQYRKKWQAESAA